MNGLKTNDCVIPAVQTTDSVKQKTSNIVKNLNGKLRIVDNKLYHTNISALFANNKKLTFTINTNKGEKITTLFSSKAQPLCR